MKPPGILPTEYIFSSYSTLSGKKSIPSLGFTDAVTVDKTVESPYFTNAAPFACAQTLPISTVRVLPASSIEKLLNIMFSLKNINIIFKQKSETTEIYTSRLIPISVVSGCTSALCVVKENNLKIERF